MLLAPLRPHHWRLNTFLHVCARDAQHRHLHSPPQRRSGVGASAVMAAAAADAGAKRKKTAIGTHSGTFHCDEALGCYMVRE